MRVTCYTYRHMQAKIVQLILLAKEKMAASPDRIHDDNHAARVVTNVIKLGKNFNLTNEQKEALVLAAWWHDVGRTITSRPSIIIMPFLDDIISAIMLGFYTVRHGLFGTSSGLAARIICCKSLGTGAILSRLFIKRKDQILVNILKDADALDVLTTERVSLFMELSETSRIYHVGYRTAVWWFTHTKQLNMKTVAARNYMFELIEVFISWLQSEEILNWQIENYGWKWIKKNIENIEIIMQRLVYLNSQSLALTA